MKSSIKVVWHLIRYAIATCISTVVSGLLPLLAASTPIFAAVAWVLVWVLDFVVYLLTGESMLQGVLVDDPFGIVLVPLMFGGIGALAVSAISLVVVAFNVLIVLPVSLATDLICQRLSVRGVVPRLGGFLLSGLLLGVAIASIMTILFGFYHPDIPVSALFVSGLVILVICDSVVFVFGLALTMLSAFKNIVIRLKARRGQKKAVTAPDEMQLCSTTVKDCG
ncbi:MAG: hypothetical protein SWK90_10295 [Chloroflexota bacterium]|nr:hypothetical protein [Chloroflexota bacterium]